jgi:cation diffusion facilitator CzcD-associated flavoprotein CzcO
MSLEWLIVGGGIHGVHIATRLIQEARLEPEQLAILDPGEQLLSNWKTRTKATGMSHLRSPSVHHLDLDPFDLQRYGKKYGRARHSHFAAPYMRPSLQLFDDHCQEIIENNQLASRHLRDKAKSIKRDFKTKQWQVQTEQNEAIQSRKVVLSLGSGSGLSWPEWAKADRQGIQHIFDPQFELPRPDEAETVAIIGGGITSAQVAIRLLKAGQRVHIIARHPIRESQFDSDPGWLGPKYMNGFNREKNYKRRRSIIKTARQRGSMPKDIKRILIQSKAQGLLHWHVGVVQTMERDGDEMLLKLNDEVSLKVPSIILATGFTHDRPGESLVQNLIKDHALPVAPCGFPLVKQDLSWSEGLHVTGALAELELGPTSRNIIGARHAADRILDPENAII